MYLAIVFHAAARGSTLSRTTVSGTLLPQAATLGTAPLAGGVLAAHATRSQESGYDREMEG